MLIKHKQILNKCKRKHEKKNNLRTILPNRANILEFLSHLKGGISSRIQIKIQLSLYIFCLVKIKKKVSIMHIICSFLNSTSTKRKKICSFRVLFYSDPNHLNPHHILITASEHVRRIFPGGLISSIIILH